MPRVELTRRSKNVEVIVTVEERAPRKPASQISSSGLMSRGVTFAGEERAASWMPRFNLERLPPRPFFLQEIS